MRRLLLASLLLVPLLAQAATPKMPPEKELKTLVLDTLTAFDKGIQASDFHQFYENKLSNETRQKFPLDRFTYAFRTFIEKGYDLSNIAKADPVFTKPPSMTTDKILNVEGYYPTKPNRVTFKLSYVFESKKWKLNNLNIRVFPAGDDTDKVPSGIELDTLVRNSLLSFNQAIQSKNFDKFHSQGAQSWQKDVSSERLLQIFSHYLDTGFDISGITKLEPMFEPAPGINEDGHLALRGWYPLKPNKISFELKYLYEDEAWKLIAVKVDLNQDSNENDR